MEGTVKRNKTIRTMTPLARKAEHLLQAVESVSRRLEYLTEALYDLERSERAAQAAIAGHAMICPLAKAQPSKPEWPELPNGEATAPAGCEVDSPGDGLYADAILPYRRCDSTDLRD